MTVTNAWLPLAMQRPGARWRLLCFPYAGGGASLFRSWNRSLDVDIEVCAVQLPGRETRMREPPFTDMDALLRALIEGIGESLDRPFALFGHSMGALIAFELARALRREKLPQPELLFLSAHRAPHLPDRRPSIHAWPSNAFWSEVGRLEGTPEEVLAHEELRELLEPLLRADFQLCETHVLREELPLEVPFHLFGGTSDPNVDANELSAWASYTMAGAEVRMLPGHHLFIQQQQHEILAAIQRDLYRASLS